MICIESLISGTEIMRSLKPSKKPASRFLKNGYRDQLTDGPPVFQMLCSPSIFHPSVGDH